MAVRLDLVATAGSDFHGKVKPAVAFGSVRQASYALVEELNKRKERLS